MLFANLNGRILGWWRPSRPPVDRSQYEKMPATIRARWKNSINSSTLAVEDSDPTSSQTNLLYPAGSSDPPSPDSSFISHADSDLERDGDVDPSQLQSGVWHFSRAAVSKQRNRRLQWTAGFVCVFCFGSIWLLKWVLVREGVIRTASGQDSLQIVPEQELESEGVDGFDHPLPVLYHPFQSVDLPVPSRNFPQLESIRTLSMENDCMELWFAEGRLCSPSVGNLPIGPEEMMDLVYLWVNGSDPIWAREREQKAATDSGKSGKPVLSANRHFRETGTMKYSLRSALKSFEAAGKKSDTGDLPNYLRKIHVLSADMPDTSPSSQEKNDKGEYRLGQIPSWLNYDVAAASAASTRLDEDGNGGNASQLAPALQWHFHSEVFHLPPTFFEQEKRESPWEDEAAWRKAALPTFNSFAIESRLGFLDDLADVSIQSNDDMFFLSPLVPADFHTLLYGSVYRLDNSWGLQVKPILLPSKVSDSGEWGGLQHANWLLSKRFPERSRSYINHFPKTLTKHILHEAALMFSKDVAVAATRPFRESKVGDGDIEFGFLITHLRIERWREALLWIWAVAKMGAREDGKWGTEARKELARILKGNERQSLEGILAVVKKGTRSSLNNADKFIRQAGHEAPKASKYSFTSMDGHLPSPPNPAYGVKSSDQCEVAANECFGYEFASGQDVDAVDMFKRLAFDQWKCGDCLIQALVADSGDSGLSSFLPAKDAVFQASSPREQAAYLPLTSDWKSTDFSLQSVVHPLDNTSPWVNLRLYSMQLLSRYLYVTADTPTRFSPLRTPGQARQATAGIESHPDLALACLNDDAADSSAFAIQEIVGQWMESRWKDSKGWWERL